MSQSHPKIVRWGQEAGIDVQSPKNCLQISKIEQKSSQSSPKMVPKRTPNSSKIDKNSPKLIKVEQMKANVRIAPVLHPHWCQKRPPNRSKTVPKQTPNWPKIDEKNDKK